MREGGGSCHEQRAGDHARKNAAPEAVCTIGPFGIARLYGQATVPKILENFREVFRKAIGGAAQPFEAAQPRSLVRE